MSDSKTIQRPLLVNLTMYLLAAAGLFNIVYSFTGVYAPYGLFYPAANMLITVGMFASFAGIGSMEKWGLYVFLAMVALKWVLDLYTGAFGAVDMALLVPTAIFLSQYRKMK